MCLTKEPASVPVDRQRDHMLHFDFFFFFLCCFQCFLPYGFVGSLKKEVET